MTGDRRGRRPVTAEERKLWRAVAKQFVPLDHSRPQPDDDSGHVPAVAPADVGHHPSRRPAPVAPPRASKPGKPAAVPQMADFEARRAKRLGAGRLPIEARLDLHGLRQDEARDALMRFLRAAQANGLRHVKVITGKGARNRDAEVRPFDLFEDDRRGVLRDQVPRWLHEAAARPLVVSFTQAAQGHGGSGALYIQIRKK